MNRDERGCLWWRGRNTRDTREPPRQLRNRTREPVRPQPRRLNRVRGRQSVECAIAPTRARRNDTANADADTATAATATAAAAAEVRYLDGGARDG